MGSAAAYHLARRGLRVLGLERFQIPNTMGASHGLTRIIRLAYFEDPAYVPLLRRSYELWRELEAEAGESLLFITGGIDAGPPGSRVFEGSLESCRQHDLDHEVLTAADLASRFPAYRLPESTLAVFQPDAGLLKPERCVIAHAGAARALGADLREGERALEWSAGPPARVKTDRGTYEADRLVLTAGPWAGALVPALAGVLQPERQVVAWFEPRRPELFTPAAFPVFVVDVPEGIHYGFPAFEIPGFKVGRFHHLREPVDPDRVDRDVRSEDEGVLRSFVSAYFPDGLGPVLRTSVCMFTNSPDENFVVDRLPEAPGVVVGAGFSGHGFKFCGVVGEVLADLAVDGRTRHEIGLFRLDRFRIRS